MVILVIEDNKDIQKMLYRKLTKQGWEVHQAENGKTGMEKAWELKPDLILMDMHMPVMDGHEATRTLRANGYQGKIAALTASVMNLEAETAIKDGCDVLIAKPIDKSFIPKVKEIAGIQKDQTHRDESQGLVVNVDKELEGLMEGFLENRKNDIQELESAIEQNRFDIVDQLAHDLIGSGKTYGFDFITDHGKVIRDAAKLQDTANIVDTIKALKKDFQQVTIKFMEEND